MTQAYPLAWPDKWPRTQRPAKSQFKTTLSAAIKNVTGSLTKFSKDSERKVENILVSSNVSLMDQNPKDAGVAVYFTWDGLATCIAVDRYQHIEENLQAIHHVIEAERTKLRHGGLNLVRAAFRGYAALPPPSSKKSAWDVLGLRPGSSDTEIEAAYRNKAQELHPDKQSGSTEKMQELNEARKKLREKAS